MNMEKRYKAVFFDLGGTLRIALKNEAYFRHARRKMAEIAGTELPYEDFYQLVDDRYKEYRKWALANRREAGDEELWRKWLLFDYDPVRIRQVCHELSFEYRQSVGLRVIVDDGVEVIRTLHDRGYLVGIISNLIGEHEVPDWIEEEGLDPYFDTVVLSSTCHIRKPDPAIYRLACDNLDVAPSDCVSVADNVGTDMPGAIAAGIGANIIFDSPEKKHPVVFTDETKPDAVISVFHDVLNYLPPLS